LKDKRQKVKVRSKKFKIESLSILVFPDLRFQIIILIVIMNLFQNQQLPINIKEPEAHSG